MAQGFYILEQARYDFISLLNFISLLFYILIILSLLNTFQN